jgi:predicted ester cyclase
VVVRWTTRGTHKGELMGIPTTGKSVVVTGIDIFHISSGKVVESWANWDALGMMQQLGVIPPMG